MMVIGAICVSMAMNAGAQATSGSIVGHVTDSSGALIPGADVIATNVDTHITFHGVTDKTGTYDLLHVTPGNYEIKASHAGFATQTTSNATVTIDQQLLQNFTLNVGEVSTETTVSAAPTLLQTQTAETGTVIGTQDILDLPLKGRNFYDLTALVPGVAPAPGNMNAFNFSVNGQREFANSIQLDGIESTTNRTQDITVTPSVDSIQEFKVATSSYNAEFGNAGGGIVSIQTKSGTNNFHGTAYEFYRPSFLAAETYSFAGGGTPSNLQQHNYGGTIGGPIKRDWSFLFLSFEGTKQTLAANGLDSVPNPSLYSFLPDGSADLSRMVDPCSGKQCKDSDGNPVGPAAGFVVPIFNPNTFVSNGYFAEQFPGNIIPANMVSKAGKNALLNFFPKPNLPGKENGWFDNYVFHQPRTTKNINVDSRLDQKLTGKDQLFIIYHYNDMDQKTTDLWDNQAVVPGAGDADQAQDEVVRGQTLSATETHLFTQHVLNEIRAGYSNYYQAQYSLLNGTDYSTKYGWGNISVPGFSATVGFPDLFLGSGYLAGGSSYKPFFINDKNWEINDNITVSQLSRHDLKFGGVFRKLNSHPQFSLFPTTYQYYGSFGYSMTNDPSYCYGFGCYGYDNAGAFFWNGGTDIADLLLGLPLDVYSGLQLTDPHTKSWQLDWYAQDTFRVNDKLTLNYGLRYEYENPYTEEKNQMANFDPKSGFILVAGIGGNSSSLMQARKNNFSPRFGFNYLLNQKTVIRGGFGINYSPENDGREDFLTKNLPFNNQTSISNNAYAGLPFAYQDDVGVTRSTAINIPSSGRIDPSTLSSGPLVTTYYVNPLMKTGNAQMFNLTVQRQLGNTLSLEAGYVAALSHNLSYQLGDINQNNVTSKSLGIIQELTDLGAGNYNALQMKFTKRESRNLSFLLSYTYSHNLDNGAAPFDAGQNNDLPQDPNNLRAEWASSDSDVRHNMVFSGLYRLPIGQGQHFFGSWSRPMELAFGGWQINSILDMRSGTPINVVDESNPKSPTNSRPDLIGNPNLPRSKRTLQEYFNTGAFVNNNLPDGTDVPGNAGRNIVLGPGYINLDFSLFKEFAMTERYKLQTRLETFNTLNTPHFTNPGGNLTDTTHYGVITSTDNNPRVVQIAAKFLF